MLLILKIQTYCLEPVLSAGECRFSGVGGTLGRSADSDLVLDDPGKIISRVQATVSFRAGSYFLMDVGRNPSFVNDQALVKGHEILLSHGDRIVVGDYKLEARLEEMPLTPASIAPSPFNNPALPLFEPPALIKPLPLLPLPSLPISPSLPHDTLGLNLFDGEMPEQMAPFIPVEYNLLAGFPQPDAVPIAVPMLPSLSTSLFTLTSQSQDTSNGPASNSSDSAMLQALLRGLGLPELKVTCSETIVAETVGALLRASTVGTMDLLMARMLTKKESRVDMTMPLIGSNNPLKFLPDVESVMTQLLTNPLPGYLPAVPAMERAFSDLKTHELALMAGGRAALAAELQRLDPVQIEQKLAPPTVMDKLLGARRKAQMWDRFVEMHGEIVGDVNNELRGLFGKQFSAAYQDQVDRIRPTGL